MKTNIARGDVTRQTILEAARKLFQQRGFDKTTMRDIAASSNIALGAAYYYFSSKNDLVLAFYEETQLELVAAAHDILAETDDLGERLKRLFALQFHILAANRKFLNVLVREASDPESPLSPFGESSADVRRIHLDIFERATLGLERDLPRDLKKELPTLLWLLQMGLIFLWLVDSSPEQARSHRVAELLADLVVHAVKLYRLPFGRTFLKSTSALAREIRVAFGL